LVKSLDSGRLTKIPGILHLLTLTPPQPLPHGKSGGLLKKLRRIAADVLGKLTMLSSELL